MGVNTDLNDCGGLPGYRVTKDRHREVEYSGPGAVDHRFYRGICDQVTSGLGVDGRHRVSGVGRGASNKRRSQLLDTKHTCNIPCETPNNRGTTTAASK